MDSKDDAVDCEQLKLELENLKQEYKKKTDRLDKILDQSDRQQFKLLKMNEELEEYKTKLEKKIEDDKILFQQSRLAQMGEMLSMIAHQWRQPLSSISSTIIGMQLEILDPRVDLSDKEHLDKFLIIQNNKFDKIVKQINMLSSIIDDFKDFFKPNKDKEKVKISTPLLQALSMVSSTLKNNNIDIELKCDAEDTIVIHKNEIIQVIINILQNSVDNFISKNIQNRKIIIKTIKEDNNICMLIEDNGGGIDEDILPKIFDPYFSTKDEKNGTGIGLYMSKMIVEEHNGGKIDAINTKDGILFNICWKV